MSERREVEHHEEHEVHHVEAEAEPPAAEAVVDAAEAAVALANATAAAAELDAAERMRAIEEEAVAWRNQTTESLASMSDSLRLLREGELSEMQTRQLELAASMGIVADRLAALEAHPSLQSTQQASAEAEEAAEAEGAPIVGAEGSASLGPAEASAGASLEASSSDPATSPGREGRKRNHRWI